MPKTSRGKTAALRRQVQDKSYWMTALKTKMNELVSEINVINRENNEMSQDESRMGSLKKKAEALAKELTGLSLELSVYNEFLDRTRIGDSVEEVKEDLEVIRSENEELQSRLEEGFEEKKKKEQMLNLKEKQLSKKRIDLERLLHSLSHDQAKVYSSLQDENVRLTNKAKQLEEEMKKLTERRKEQEASLASGSDDPFLRKEILQSLDHLNELEKQRDDLNRDVSSSSSSRDERGRLLAQVKRDNREVADLESRIRDIKVSLEEVKSELEGYEDMASIQKYREVKKREKSMDEFLKDFDKDKQIELDKLIETGGNIRATLDKISRIITHIDGLKASSSRGSSAGGGIERLEDEKRKLELDLSKMERLEVSLNSQVDSYRSKIKSLEQEMTVYSDIAKLKQDIESRSESLQEEKERLSEQIERLKRDNEQFKQDVLIKKQSLEKNEAYSQLKVLERKLTEVLSVNERLEAGILQSDHTFIKQRVLNEAKKYNQRLQGF